MELAAFPGETREIHGRTYLRFDDYVGWKGRAVKGKLQKEPGIVAGSWNDWRRTQGDKASLDGVPVGPIECWADRSRFTVHEGKLAQQLAAARDRLLQQRRAQTLHDLDGEPGYFARIGPFDKRTFLDETLRWREEALAFSSQVCSLRTTLSKVSERYFDGTPVILSQESAQMEALAEMWSDLLGQFNDLIVSEFEQAPDGPRLDRLEAAALLVAGETQAVEQTAYLVDSAKAEALKDMREEEAAVGVMGRWN